MSDDLDLNALEKAVQDVFGELCFLDAVPTSQRSPGSISQVLFVPILKPFHGSLEVFLPLELKRRMVENIHSKSWGELTPGQIDDSLLEFANIVTGRFLALLTRGQAAFKSGLPELKFEHVAPGLSDRLEERYFDVEGLWAGFRLTLQGGSGADSGG